MVTIVRTETHALSTSPALRQDVERTVAFYRRVVRMSATVAMTHWPELGALRNKERQMALEALFHATKERPVVRYAVLGRALGKMPSYLRRAALHAALGAVSSFLSNYSLWLEGEIGGKKREVGSRAPRLGYSGVFPSLYGGNMMVMGAKALPLKAQCAKPARAMVTPYGCVRIKLLGANGQWAFSEPLKMHGQAKRLKDIGAMDLSPTLMQRGAKVWLSCPVEVKAPTYLTNKALIQQAKPFRVCSVDVGINTAATLAIVDSAGTVIAREFLLSGRHNDQRDRLGVVMADKQRASGAIERGKPFCSGLHRRMAGISLDAARTLASEIIAFAKKHDASLLAIEDLKGWKPKGPSRNQRKRFHRFQHRMLIQYLSLQAQELGLRVLEVYARGTSRWAYDGSGKVVRSPENAQLARFTSGKQYNADLNGALNIAARAVAMVLGIKARSQETEVIKSTTGKSSGVEVRMPLVLADIWRYAKSTPPNLRKHVNRSRVSEQRNYLLSADAPVTIAGAI